MCLNLLLEQGSICLWKSTSYSIHFELIKDQIAIYVHICTSKTQMFC